MTTTFAPVQFASLTPLAQSHRCHPIDILDNVIKVQNLAINVQNLTFMVTTVDGKA